MITQKMKARATLGLDVLTKYGISPIISASIKAELRSVLGSYYLQFQEISSRNKVDSRTLSKIINGATCAHCGTLTDYCSGKRSLCLRCSQALPKADRVRYKVESAEKTLRGLYLVLVGGTMCQLPQKWFNWDREKLVKYVADSQIDVSLLPQGRFQCHLLHTDKQPA